MYVNTYSLSSVLYSLFESPNSKAETYNYLKSNFDRHYTTSKAPFGIYLTANGWFQSASYRLEGYMQFLDYLSTKDDVYIVPIAKVNPRLISFAFKRKLILNI